MVVVLHFVVVFHTHSLTIVSNAALLTHASSTTYCQPHIRVLDKKNMAQLQKFKKCIYQSVMQEVQMAAA